MKVFGLLVVVEDLEIVEVAVAVVAPRSGEQRLERLALFAFRCHVVRRPFVWVGVMVVRRSHAILMQ